MAKALPDLPRAFNRGPHGPSQIVDPSRFSWTDAAWRGVATIAGHLMNCMSGHTRKKDLEICGRELPSLAELGVSVIEVMPVAEFNGAFGWGYDGVNFFAPTHTYGLPDDFRSFVDTAHSHNLGVILDVVYNHLGPDGNYCLILQALFYE